MKIACTKCGVPAFAKRYGGHWPRPYLCAPCGGEEKTSPTLFEIAFERAYLQYQGTMAGRYGAKLTFEQVVRIYTSGGRAEALAIRYKMSVGSVQALKRGTYWSKVTKPLERWRNGKREHEVWFE